MVSLRTVEYEVTGTTAAQVQRSMLALAENTRDGVQAVGLHSTRFIWRYRHAASSFACSPLGVVVELRGDTILPRWNPPQNAAPKIVAGWARFIEALKRHEAGHRDIGIAIAADLRQQFVRMRSRNCELLDMEAKRLGELASDQMQRENVTYDRNTRHGLSQGTAWPSRDD